MLLFLFAALITAAVAWSLARPMLKALGAPADAGTFNVAVYRDQLRELERDVARGVVGETDAAAARTEIERRLLSAGAPASAPVSGVGASRTAAILVALAVAIAAGGVYLAIGDPAAPDRPLRARTDLQAAAPGGDEMHAQMNDLVGQLAEKLKERPNDAQGWALMARSLMRLERAPEAVDAYRRALDLSGGRDGALAGEYAEARIIAADGTVDREAKGIFEHMLREEPGNPQARYYLALARLQAGDRSGALADWRALLADSPPDAPWRATLERQIADAGGPAPSSPPAVSAPAPSPGPSAADVEAAGQMSEGDRAAMIDAMVTQLAARLKQSPNDLDGWRRLARAYDVLGRKDDAARAHERVLALAPNDADALWSLGLYAKDRGDIAGARRRWQALERALPAGAPERAQVREALATLGR